MNILDTILCRFHAFKTHQLWRLARNRTRRQLAKFPAHLADDLDLWSIGISGRRTQ